MMSVPPMAMKGAPPPGSFGQPSNAPPPHFQSRVPASGGSQLPPPPMQSQQRQQWGSSQVPPQQVSNNYNGFNAPPSGPTSMNIAPPMGGGLPRNSMGQLNNTPTLTQSIQSPLQQGSPGLRMFAPPSSVGPPPPSSVGPPPSSVGPPPSVSSPPLLNGPSSMPLQSVNLYANTSVMGTPQPPLMMNTRPPQQQQSPPQMQQQSPQQMQQQLPPHMLQQPPPPTTQQQQQMYNVRAPPPGGTIGVGPPPMNKSPRPPMPGAGMGGIGPPLRGPDPQFRNSPGPTPPGIEQPSPAGNYMQGKLTNTNCTFSVCVCVCVYIYIFDFFFFFFFCLFLVFVFSLIPKLRQFICHNIGFLFTFQKKKQKQI